MICSPSIRTKSHLIRPTLAQEDYGYTMWESKAILRYICNKHTLEQWYPTDYKKRGTCDLALDHFNVWVTEITYKLLYPAAGFAPPVEDSVIKAAEVGTRTPRCICIRAILRACWLCMHVCIGGVQTKCDQALIEYLSRLSMGRKYYCCSLLLFLILLLLLLSSSSSLTRTHT